MSAEIINPALGRAARAGKKTLKVETGVPLVDIDPLTAAEFLSVRSWKRRGAWFDSIIIDSIGRTMQLVELLDEKALFGDAVTEMRKKITQVLDHLDHIAPLPLDEEAMRIFRVCDDPERVALAVRHWPDNDAELAGLRAASGCMVLRNMSIHPLGAPAVRRALGFTTEIVDDRSGGAS